MSVSVRHPLARLLAKRRLRILGVNSGTSLNGLDLALVSIGDGAAPRLLRFESVGYSLAISNRLRRLAVSDTVVKRDAAQMHVEYARWIADCIQRFQHRLSGRSQIDAIGVHGQTIGHFPADRKGRGRHATWQIGAPSVIAAQTGIITVGDFRTGDIAAGGMGAPLSGYYHHLMFGPEHVVLNLGGIANVSASRIRSRRLEILAFDIGPANMVLDDLSQMLLGKPFDRAGERAEAGSVIEKIVRRALRDPYLQRRPPKTCGREEFGDSAIQRWFPKSILRRVNAEDCLATATAITARAVARAVTKWIEPFTRSRSLIIAGGGAQNAALMQAISKALPAWTVADSDRLGFPPQTVEPSGFAVLAYETLHARPGNLGGATGGRPAVLGVIALPAAPV